MLGIRAQGHVAQGTLAVGDDEPPGKFEGIPEASECYVEDEPGVLLSRKRRRLPGGKPGEATKVHPLCHEPLLAHGKDGFGGCVEAVDPPAREHPERIDY